MNEQIKKILQRLNQLWKNTSSTVKKIFISGMVLSIIIALSLSILLNTKEYVVIFDQLSETESSEILSKLQGMGVDVKIGSTGSIMVLEENEANVRMSLATEGYPKSGLSYYLIEEGSGMLTTDYQRKQYANMQLQERIAASIKTLEGVKDAIVTITVPEEKIFYLQKQERPTASVIIHMMSGSTLTEGQIQGILNLVSKSVTGLPKDNIALSDGQGNDLIGNSMSNSGDLLKLSITREIENDIKKKVLNVLDGPYRTSQLRVSVTAEVNTDQLVTEETLFTPSDDGVNTGVVNEAARSEDSYTSDSGNGGVAGTSGNSEVNTYPGGGTTGESVSSSSTETRKYLVSEKKSQAQKTGAKTESISIGIAIDKEFLEEEERNRTAQLVAFAAGVNVDNITIQNYKFYTEESEDDTGIFEEEDGTINKKYLLFAGIAGIVLLIVALIIGLLIRKRKQALKLKKAQEAEHELLEGGSEGDAVLDELFGKIKLDPIVQITPVLDAKKKEIQEFAKTNPEIVAQMIKSLLRSDNDEQR